MHCGGNESTFPHRGSIFLACQACIDLNEKAAKVELQLVCLPIFLASTHMWGFPYPAKGAPGCPRKGGFPRACKADKCLKTTHDGSSSRLTEKLSVFFEPSRMPNEKPNAFNGDRETHSS